MVLDTTFANRTLSTGKRFRRQKDRKTCGYIVVFASGDSSIRFSNLFKTYKCTILLFEPEVYEKLNNFVTRTAFPIESLTWQYFKFLIFDSTSELGNIYSQRYLIPCMVLSVFAFKVGKGLAPQDTTRLPLAGWSVRGLSDQLVGWHRKRGLVATQRGCIAPTTKGQRCSNSHRRLTMAIAFDLYRFPQETLTCSLLTCKFGLQPPRDFCRGCLRIAD